jgi:formate hydrogenlyase subunit 3/multisubunit Na+/H+ antiporter MnhD subunit
MHELLYVIVIPAVMGAVTLFFPKKVRLPAGILALLASAWMFFKTIQLFGLRGAEPHLEYARTIFTIGDVFHFDFALKLTNFSAFVLLFIALFGVLIILYSIGYWFRDRETPGIYYTYLLWTLAVAACAVLSDNLLLLLVTWEILTLLLYMLVNMGGEGAETAAQKCFTILGFSDAAMLLGVIIIWMVYGTLSISALSAEGIPTGTVTGIFAFLLLFTGAIAKAGAMPLHSWVPAIAESTPAPTMAFLPAALDKLLGIYLLARISLDIFAIRPGSGLSLMMMIIGAVTILFAVLMALVQHDLKKLLSFHAVSQVGYMVLGVGSGIPVAIVGGLFHMLNNAIYKSGLFLSAGAVEKRAGTTDLEQLGGLARLMPVTFLTTMVAALSISGVPPFNGFVSKWLVYQGMLEGPGYNIIFLIVAVFGSALTLASFVKVIHSVFLGRRQEKFDGVREAGFTMQVPMIFLAILCIVFGIYAQFPIEQFIAPSVAGSTAVSVHELTVSTASGYWSPVTATLLMIAGLIVGLIIYAFGRTRHVRLDENVWVGGNILDNEEMRIPGTQFYKTVTDDLYPAYSALFRDGEGGALDIYNIWGLIGSNVVEVLRRLHNGILSTYLSWTIIGLGALTFILMFFAL